MENKEKIDLVVFFHNYFHTLGPFLRIKRLNIDFSSTCDTLFLDFDPFDVISDLSYLTRSLIINFTRNKQYIIRLQLAKVSASDYKVALEIDLQNCEKSFTCTLQQKLKLRFKPDRWIRLENIFRFYFIKEDSCNESKHETRAIAYNDIPSYYAEIRKRLKSHFSSIESFEEMANRKSLEKGVFLSKVNQVIARHIDNEHFDIAVMTKELGISRSKLYRLLSPLVRMSPGQYIIYFRLQKAKVLLHENNYSVGQVATMMGFSSHSHFTRVFCEQFGINPSNLLRSSKA